MLFSLPVNAVTYVDRYLDPNASGDGTGSNWTNAYTSMATLESTEQAAKTNLVARDEILRIYASSGSGVADIAADWSDWTTDTTHYVEIIGDGTYSMDGNDLDDTLDISIIQYMKFTNITIICRTPTSTARNGVHITNKTAGANKIEFDRCKFQVIKSGTGTNGKCVYVNNSNAITYFRNCIFDCGTKTDNDYSALLAGGAQTYVYNCTITNAYYGINRTAGIVSAKNSVIFDTAANGNFNGTDIECDYCASDDADSNSYTNGVDWDAGATDYETAFTDYANGNYTIKDSGSSLYNVGTDLSGSSVTVDYIGTARPQASLFDIGAYELIVAATPPTNRKSRIVNINMH